jgi:ABC-2 type transport system permease protein
MGYFGGIYAIWVRELIIFFREKERFISAVVTPLMWIFIFGNGLGSSMTVGATSYQEFVFPGIVSMAVLFGSIFYGMYIIWDRKLDFLKEVLVAPLPRSGVFLGKMLGGMSNAFVEIVILLAIGMAFGFVPNIGAAAAATVFGVLLSVCLVSLGLIIGANMKSPEGFNLVMSFIMWPMFMLSGALFPLENLPGYLDLLVSINPMTYGVDLVRYALIGTTHFGVLADCLVLIAASAVFIAIGTRSFEKMQI